MVVRSGGRIALRVDDCWILGTIFAALGIIADAMRVMLGLEPVRWLMLWIALFVGSTSWYTGWVVVVYLHARGQKSTHRALP